MPTAIVFTPHPDDESYAFGGLIALLADAGWRISVEVATAGEQGERHDTGTADARTLGIERLGELAHACAILGAESPHCWGLPDGSLRETADQSDRIVTIIRQRTPDLVLSLGSDGAYGHPDHIALYGWLTTALESLGSEAPPTLFAAFPPGLFLPQWQLCVSMMGDPPSPSASQIGTSHFDYTIDITQAATRKLAAIAAHRTQLPNADPTRLFPLDIIPALLAVEYYTGSPGLTLPL